MRANYGCGGSSLPLVLPPFQLQLLAALIDEPNRSSHRIDGKEEYRKLVALAGQNLVSAALWPALRATPTTHLEPDLADYLEALHSLNLQRNLRLVRQAAELAIALNRVGVEPVFLKGMALQLLGIASDPGIRLIGDIDILIPTDRFDIAADILRTEGYRDINAPRPEAHDRARLLRSDRPALVELHHYPVPYYFEGLLPTWEMLVRSQALTALAPARIRIPCPEHLVLHNIIHAMLHHRGFQLSEVSLRDAFDLGLLARTYSDELDWNEIIQRMATGRDSASALEFYIVACRSLLPEVPLPDVRAGSRAQAALRRWMRRRGSPASRLAHLSMRARELAQDLVWRLLHEPEQRRRLLDILLTPRRYPERARHFVDALRYGVVPFPSRRAPEAVRKHRSDFS